MNRTRSLLVLTGLCLATGHAWAAPSDDKPSTYPHQAGEKATPAYSFIVGDGSGGGAGTGGAGGAGGGNNDVLTAPGSVGNVLFGDGSGGGGGASFAPSFAGGAGGAAGSGNDTLTGNAANDILIGDGFAGAGGGFYGGVGGLGGGGGGGGGGQWGNGPYGAAGGLCAGAGGGGTDNGLPGAPLVPGCGHPGSGNGGPGGASQTTDAGVTGTTGGNGGGGFGGAAGGGNGGNGNTDVHTLTSSGAQAAFDYFTEAHLRAMLNALPSAGHGADILDGKGGSNELFGLGGNDTFVIDSSDNATRNRIWDFAPGDQVLLKTGGATVQTITAINASVSGLTDGDFDGDGSADDVRFAWGSGQVDIINPPRYSIGGTLLGLPASNSVVLQNNAGDNLTLSANGAFVFSGRLFDDTAYAVTVLTQPATPNTECIVSNGSGTTAGSNIANVMINCSTSYVIGGTVSGLAADASVVLRNNGGDDLVVSADGGFQFAALLASASGYDVSIATQPDGQTCEVYHGSGTVASADVTNISVACAINTTNLNDTGETRCFDDTSTATGTVSGSTPAPEASGFEGQDCSFGAAAADALGVQLKIGDSSVPGRDYSKIANSGAVLSAGAAQGAGANDWGCTRDNITGLTWELRPDDGSLRDRDHRFSWADRSNDEGDTCNGQAATCDTDAYVAAVNAAGVCGANDWRLPTPYELLSLVALQDASSNLVDGSWIPDQDDAQALAGFWTNQGALNSITYPPALETPTVANGAWAVFFDAGFPSDDSVTSAKHVRLVRGGESVPTSRFIVSDARVAGEFTTTDSLTGLEWKTCPQGLSGSDCLSGSEALLDWTGALQAASAETFAGKSDWRLPNVAELGSIRDFPTSAFAAIDQTAFPNSNIGFATYWSSSSEPGFASFGLAYRFQGTLTHESSVKTSTFLVRLVRGGNFLEAHAAGADTTPSAFSIGAKGAPLSTIVESDAITVAGLGTDVPASVKVSGAAESAYSINGGVWRSRVGAVRNGDAVRVRHRAAAAATATASTTLNIGGVSADFVSTAVGAPTAPLNVVATAGDAQASVAFDAPASNGGAAIVSYTATSNPGGRTGSCSQSPCTVSGLSNGTSYTFTVVANNGLAGPASAPASNAVVPQAPQTIVFGTPPTIVVGSSSYVSLSAGGSGNPVVIESQTPETCAVESYLYLRGTAAGDCTITANQAGNAAFRAAAQAILTFAIGKGTQSIAFYPPAERSVAQGSFQAAATGGPSPNQVTFSSLSTGICTSGGSNGATITPVAEGTCQIRAAIAADANYEAASSDRSITIVANYPPTIAFASASPRLSFPVNHNALIAPFDVADHELIVRDPDLAAGTTFAASGLQLSATITGDPMGSPATRAVVTPYASLDAAVGQAAIPLKPDGSFAAYGSIWGQPWDSGNVILSRDTPPQFPAAGPRTLTYTVTDANGASASVSRTVELVEVNVPPSATYLESYQADFSTAGGYTVPGFVVSESPGPDSEAAQTVEHVVFPRSSGVFSPRVSNTRVEGSDLKFDVSYGGGFYGGSELVCVYPRDNGLGRCTEFGTICLSPISPLFPVSEVAERCGTPRLVSLVDRSWNQQGYFGLTMGAASMAWRQSPTPTKAQKAVSAGELTATYAIEVSNLGGEAVSGLRIVVPLPAQLSSASWSCTATTSACAPASGTGALSLLVDLAPVETATISFEGVVKPDAGYVEIKPAIVLPAGNTGEVLDPGKFLIHPVSAKFVHLGGFEGP